MPVERREQVTRAEIVRVNGQPEELAGFGGRRQPSLGGTSRMNREIHVRICERLGVRFPGATRQARGQPASRTPDLSYIMESREPVNILLVDDQPAKLLSYEVILSALG